MSLVDILCSHGHKLQGEGSCNHRLLGHGGLIVKDNYWYSHSLGKGGSANSLLQHLGHSKINEEQSVVTASKKEVLNKTLKALSYRGRNYLRNRRIDQELIDLMSKQGLVAEDEKGYLAFVGCDLQGEIRCISKRALTPLHRIQKWEATGSDKRWSFSFPIHSTGGTLILCEGPIDALSIACLENRKHQQGYHQSCKVSTCGAPVQHMLKRILAIAPNKIYLAFDTDSTGISMGKKAREMLLSLNIPVLDVIPGKGKDPNDWLRNTML